MKVNLLFQKLAMLLVVLLVNNSISAQCPIAGYKFIGMLGGHAYYLSIGNAHPSAAYPLSEAVGGYLASITSSPSV
jgi:ABC-type Fe3+-siderophore transport system permease subunit